jgi:tetratricopeptide (TPR) repeat protein
MGAVACVTFSPDGSQLASAGDDPIVRLWNPRTGDAVRDFTGHTLAVPGVAFSPDGKTLATASRDHTARVWDVASGRVLLVFDGPVGSLVSVAFSPDGQRLATGSSDSTVRLWDILTGTEQRVLKGHTGQITCLAFSPDGTRLATGSTDQTARLWDTETATELLQLKGHAGAVNSLAFDPDGRCLITGSSDQTSRLWDARISADVELDRRLWATRFDANWHGEQLQTRRLADDWLGALYHVNQLLRSQPADDGLLRTRRSIVFDAIKRDPKAAAAQATVARLILEMGHFDEYRKKCAILSDLAGDFKDEVLTRQLAAACILAPRALADMTKLIDAFHKTMNDKDADDLRLYGGLMLRAGKQAEAIEELEAARRVQGAGISPATHQDTAYVEMLLALAYQQLKKPDKANECLAHAVAVLDRMPICSAVNTVSAGWLGPLQVLPAYQIAGLRSEWEFGFDWQTSIELQVLRGEAAKTQVRDP